MVGAASSAEAVNGLAVALAAEDVVGAAAMLPPSEIGHAVDLYGRVIELAQKEGGLAGDNPLAGIDIQVADLDIRVDALHERVHKVYLVDGDLGVTVDPSSMDANLSGDAEPVDESITLAEINEMLADEAAAYEPDGILDVRPPSELFVMVVHERGRWFVSPLYTTFEYARMLFDLPPVDYEGSSVDMPPGTDTASGVLQQVVDQVNGFDLDAQIETVLDQIRTGVLVPSIDPSDPLQGALPVAPDEMAVFLDHLPMFQGITDQVNESMTEGMDADEMTEMIEGLATEMEPALDITLEIGTTEEKLDDERTKVVVTDAVLHVVGSVTLPEGAGGASADATLTIRGTCAVFDYLGELPGEQGPDRSTGLHEGCLEDAVPGLGVDGLFVVARRIDGSWYLSPVETVVEYLAVVLDAALSGAFDGLDLEDMLFAPLVASEAIMAPMEMMGGDAEMDDGYSQSATAGSVGFDSALAPVDSDMLAEDCSDGDMFSCDILWDYSEPGSSDEQLASGCGDPVNATSEGGGFAYGACSRSVDLKSIDSDGSGWDDSGEWGAWDDCIDGEMPDDVWRTADYVAAQRACLDVLSGETRSEILAELEFTEPMVPYTSCMEEGVGIAGGQWDSAYYNEVWASCIPLAPEEMQAEMLAALDETKAMEPFNACMDVWYTEQDPSSSYLETLKGCLELAPADRQADLLEEIALQESWAEHDACMETELGAAWWNADWTDEFQDRMDAAYVTCADLEPEYGEVEILEVPPEPDDAVSVGSVSVDAPVPAEDD